MGECEEGEGFKDLSRQAVASQIFKLTTLFPAWAPRFPRLRSCSVLAGLLFSPSSALESVQYLGIPRCFFPFLLCDRYAASCL